MSQAPASETPAPPVGRLAPSPTGRLHLGHARSFLLAWWSVRARGGRMLLRMEDLDASRVRPEFTGGILADLEWLGLDWDGEPTFQSQRLELYRAAVDELAAKDLLYPCVCTRREIREAQSAPHADDATSAYPGTCRDRFRDTDEARASSGRIPALRLRVPPGPVPVADAFLGPHVFEVASEVGDFPVWTREAIPAYQLAVVVDDAAQGVTEVLRGDDLLSSSARQSLLQDALGLPQPTWIHVPLVTDPTGRRLASRSADLTLADLRAAGVDPRAVVAWVARSAGIPVEAPTSAAALSTAFDLAALPPVPVALPPDPTAALRELF